MENNTLKMKKKELSRSEFKVELKKLKTKLPKHYGILIKTLYPEIDVRKVYNVVNYNVHDEDVLEKLRFLVPSEN